MKIRKSLLTILAMAPFLGVSTYAQVASLSSEYSSILSSLSNEIEQPDFINRCQTVVNEASYKLIKLRNENTDNLSDNLMAEDLLTNSFNLRMKLHEKIEEIRVSNLECQKDLKDLYTLLHKADDLVGSYQYQNEQKHIDKVDYTKVAVPILESEKYNTFHVNSKLGDFKFKNGDIFITKGVSVVSSTISNVASPDNVYSHIVLVHVDKKTGKTETIESYIGVGVTLFSIEDALKNENSRILILRAKDSELADRAADYMYERVTSLKKQGKVIPYDFNLDFENNSTLSCEEVAYDAFNTVSGGKFQIPEIKSFIGLNADKFLKRISMKKGEEVMLPADMETDSRFDIVLDWTDYSIIRDEMRKDLMMKKVESWLASREASKADIKDTFKAKLGKAMWAMKNTFLWPLFSKISGIPKDFTHDVPGDKIATIADLKAIEADMIHKIRKHDEDFFKAQNRWPNDEELGQIIEKVGKSKKIGGNRF